MSNDHVNPYGVDGYDATTYGDSFAEVYDQWYEGLDDADFLESIVNEKNFPKSVSFMCGDFSEQLPSGPFEVVFIGYNTLFNVPDAQALQNCIKNVSSVLNSSGSLYIDAVIPSSTDDSTHEFMQTMATGEEVLATSHHDPLSQRITGTFTHLGPENLSRIRSWAVRYFTPPQLDAIAEQSGLALFSRYADGRQTPFTSDSHRHVSRYSPTV